MRREPCKELQRYNHLQRSSQTKGQKYLWGCSEKADSDSVSGGWDLRCGVSKGLLGNVDPAGLWAPRGYQGPRLREILWTEVEWVEAI